jgi:hypothetical protein
MESKDEYITQLSKSVTKISNKTIQEIEQHIRKFLESENMLICKDTTEVKPQEQEQPRNRNIPSLEMYYVEFNGHVYLADKKNRVFTCNKDNPVEIGYIRETEEERVLVKYEGYEHL